MWAVVVGILQDETQKNRPVVTAPPPPGYCVAICFYCVALGHMFLLFGCGPYVSIMCRWAICFYWLAVGVGLGHMFLLCAAGPYVSIVCVYVYMCVCVYMCMCVCMCVCVCVCMYVCVCVTICFHRRLL